MYRSHIPFILGWMNPIYYLYCPDIISLIRSYLLRKKTSSKRSQHDLTEYKTYPTIRNHQE
jgi:hypothetical protein